MKKILIIFFAFAILASGCKDDGPSLDAPSSKLEGINDDWQLSEVLMIDKSAGPFALKEFDVSAAYFGSNPSEMSFNSADFTYTHNSGSAPDLFGASGTWAFDDNDFPTLITINDGSGPKVLTLVRTVRATDQTLQFEVTKDCAGSETIGYQYVFIRK